MAANRIDPAPTQEDAAAPAAAEAAAPAAASNGGFKSWLPLLVTIVVMPIVAFGMTQFVLLPQLKKGLVANPEVTASATTKDSKASADAKRETVPMNKLLVNVSGTMGARYLLVSLSISGSPEFKPKVESHDPQLRDFACGVLATKTIADLEKPGARNSIRTELINGFNNILGGSLVQEIYLTEFAIQ
jgi:flagellar basal body-associated protein FliL